MVVKSVRGRRRYVYVRVPEGTRRDDLAGCMSERFDDTKAITCRDGDAVIRCSPRECEAVVDHLISSGLCTGSVKTSGTLRTLRDEYPQLRVPQKRRR